MALDHVAKLGERETVLELYGGDIQRINVEVIVMGDAVVPRRARAVVAVVMAFHLAIALEPAGVIVEALYGARRSQRMLLAARHDAFATRALAQLAAFQRDVSHQPMDEFHA